MTRNERMYEELKPFTEFFRKDNDVYFTGLCERVAELPWDTMENLEGLLVGVRHIVRNQAEVLKCAYHQCNESLEAFDLDPIDTYNSYRTAKSNAVFELTKIASILACAIKDGPKYDQQEPDMRNTMRIIDELEKARTIASPIH